MKKIRIGLIGLGQIAQVHLRNYAEIEDVELVAGCDVDNEVTERVCDKYGIPNRCSDFRELLRRDDLDAVDVCLHNNFHAPVSIAAMRAGKHVYCEKPIAGSYVDGKEMLDVSRETGTMLHIQLASLYSTETKTAKHLADAGRLGSIYHGRSVGSRRRGRPFIDGYGTDRFVKKELTGGGALYDMGIYHIAQVLFLMGLPEADRISGRTYQETSMDPHRKASSGYDVEEFAAGFVTFKNGATLDIAEAWAMHLDSLGSSVILGSEGGVSLDPFRFFTTYEDLALSSEIDLKAESFRRSALSEQYAALASSQLHWVRALQGRTELLPTAELALETMLIQEGIYMSHRQNREIKAAEVKEKSESCAVKL
jgi:predicted dehydrogenase